MQSQLAYTSPMTHKGFRITVRNTVTRVGKGLTVSIDGHVLDVRTDRNRDAALADAARYVDASINRPDAYTWTRDLTPAQLERKLAAK